MKTFRFCHKYVTLLLASFHNITSGLSILMHGIISLPYMTSYDKQHYIWVFTVCQSTHLGVTSIQRVKLILESNDTRSSSDKAYIFPS